MKVSLDTSAYSALMRGHAAVQSALQNAEMVYVSPVVLGELLAGFRAGAHLTENKRRLQTFLSSPGVEGLTVDDETAERYAAIVGGLKAAGTPIPSNDAWIAASAMQYGLCLVTTDRHFQKIPQILVDYYEAVRIS